MQRREVLLAGGGLLAAALVAEQLTAGPASAAPPAFKLLTPATKVAARTDRRPVAGGVYDPVAKKTFVSWAGADEDSYVQAYDHAAGTWSAKNRIIGGGGDSHNYPTLVLAADGHLLIFVGQHNVDLVMARSPQPHSAAGTWTVKTILEAPAASYPMPVRTANGDLFLFYRETTEAVDPTVATDVRPVLYVRSTDHGATWRSSKQLTGHPYALGSTTRTDHLNEVYLGQLRYEPARNRIHLVWTKAGGGPTQNLHDYYHKDLHHAVFDPATLHFRSASGADLGTQLGDTDQDQACRVATTPLVRPAGLKSPDYIQLVGWLDDGRPFLTWFTFDDNALAHNQVSVWTGGRWQSTQVALGLRTREMERVAADTWRVYACRDGQPGIATFLVGSGRTWKSETTIATPGEVQRIELISGFRDPARILATGASSARETSVADGDVYVAGT